MKLAYFTLVMTFLFENYLVSVAEQGKNDENEGNNVDLFNKCYDELGCIDTDSRWYDKKLRPVNLRPVDRHIIKTDFLLLKLNTSCTPYLLYNSMAAKDSSIKSSGFNEFSDTYILIHDFTSNGYSGWIKHLSMIMLTKSNDINIVSVDWQRGAEPPYDQAIANARVVALEIIALLKELKVKFSMDFNKIHIIGHGVGAHIAGYVGTVYNGIKKITGLDPSGPRFEGMPDIVKLNPTNARYVEVIHTDAIDDNSQGAREPMGHSDFYVNDASTQPGCSVNTSFNDLTAVGRSSINEGEILPGCSHKRAFKYFIESVDYGKCIFLGIKCNNYEDFANGQCVSCTKSEGSCRTFGLKTYKNCAPRTLYFLNTADHSPYCMYEYRITVSLQKSEQDFYGYFDFILVDENADVAEASLSDPKSMERKYRGGYNNSFVYYAPAPKIEKIKEVKVRWNEKKKFYCFIYCKQAIKVEHISIQFLGTGRGDEGCEEDLCPANHELEIENGCYIKFVNCNEVLDKTTPTPIPKSTSNVTTTTTSAESSAPTEISPFPAMATNSSSPDKNG